MVDEPTDRTGNEIAIVGMACRFPGAADVETYWRNLRGGVESITTLSDEALERAGVPPEVYRDPRYVRRVPVLDGVDLFDAEFFGYTPLEARLIDPQQRLFLECAWEALERAGHDPHRHAGPTGVFTGSKTNTYLFNIVRNQELMRQLDSFQIALGNDLAAMATRLSFKLDLRGPSYAIHTACSTSLVAVHLACQSLLLGECRMALAGGAAINVPQERGYLHQEGGILSRDGSCRTFDAGADGSNFGNGVGVVVLKRLDDALADGDHVSAVIKGSATNNDGARKASFTAPGVGGQTEVILEALAVAGVSPDSIDYLEAHGTATELGDSIEMLALTQAFRAASERSGFCAVGSAKTNLGHLETAAGVAGLIKAALALERGELPPSLHFESANPRLEIDGGPFYVNAALAPWPRRDGRPRRAGVSSFGIGSTNAHVVLEEAPPAAAPSPSRRWQLLALSARSESALDAAGGRLAAHLAAAPEQELADVAYTLQVGRRRFRHRRVAVVDGRGDAAAVLGGEAPERLLSHREEASSRTVALMFPGLGEHYPGMARGLYDDEPVFRREVDRLAELFEPHVGLDLRQAIFTGGARREGGGPDLRRMLGRGAGRGAGRGGDDRLSRTAVAQPAMFVVEHALAELWRSWGVEPDGLVGYSLGEYVAACRAGVFSLEDAVALVAARARMIDALPAGAMLAVALPEEELVARLGDQLSLAAVNGPRLAVAAGPVEAVAELEAALGVEEVVCRRLDTTHAFHSSMMEPIAGAWAERVAEVELSAPRIPFVSNVTGTWITAEQATDPGYWAEHLRRPVRFFDGLRALLADPARVLLEMGPGQSLGSFAKLHPDCASERAGLVLSTLPGAFEGQPDQAYALTTLGRLWLAGLEVDWDGFHAAERRLRVPLPTYPFERRRHWVDPDELAAAPAAEASAAAAAGGGRRVTLDKQADMAAWFYRPVWRPAEAPPVPPDGELAGLRWLVLADEEADGGLSAALVARLRRTGAEVAVARPGERFAAEDDGGFRLPPGEAEGHAEMLRGLAAEEWLPDRVVHLWCCGGAAGETPLARFDAAQDRGLHALLFLAQALGRQASGHVVEITAVTSGVQRVDGLDADGAAPRPERATLLGPLKVIPQEIPGLTCRAVDVEPPAGAEEAAALAERLLAELGGEALHAPAVALRGDERRLQDYEPAPQPALDAPPAALREEGVYVLTGGLGGLGLELAEHLARTCRARLVLTRRSPLPPRETWEELAAGDDGAAVLPRRLLAFEELGAEVLALSADAADRGDMERVRQAALERFGAVHGVVHLAGVPGGGIIQLKTRAAAEAIVTPKARGALVAHEVFFAADEAGEAGEAPDFLFLFSSIASVLGEFGQADYCGANAFLDAFAQARAAAGGAPVQVADWDVWSRVGLAVHTEVPEHLRAWRREMLEQAIDPAEGVEAFDRVLAAGLPQVVVSAQPLAGRIELGKRFTGESFLAELAKVSGSGGAAPKAAGGDGPRRALGTGFAAAGGGLQRRIAAVWERVLGVEQVGVHDNFFDLGGNSLVGLQLVAELGRELGVAIPPVTLFESPTVAALARQLDPGGGEAESAADDLAARRRRLRTAGAADDADRRIAVVGMAGRFPGAPDVAALWRNLAGGVESITFFDEAELAAAGVDPELYRDPRYVRAGAVLEGVETFDAGLFGYSPREAEVMDPQHRVFLECAWEALEHAGYDSSTYPGSIGVFAGSNLSTYLLQLYADPEVQRSVNMLQAILGNDKDSLTTTVSYKLDLRGPSVAVQTFCSTSLVAVHMAMRSLRGGECDMALAGGIRIVTPHHQGYLYEEGGIAPRDGHARSFDAKADGSVLGNGVGIVVLKRLSDALADGDHVHAVLLGSGLNNDGSLKAGYTAPSVAGQAAAVAEAYEDAGVAPSEIQYVEAHGSATELGDPIEVTALTQAFRRWTADSGYCRIGSVKSNFGHLDRAAGVTGLIKTVMALEHRQVPPSINFDEPNPKIDFAASPFVVNTALAEWEAPAAAPRRAAVNSLGMGGTNVHVVVEEAPPAPAADEPSRPWQLLVLSARSAPALDAATANLRRRFEERPETPLADAAWTLQVGRRALEHRRAVVCHDAADAALVLSGDDPKRLHGAWCEPGERSVAFLFPGLGGHYLGMARGLYDGEEVFRREVDRCAELLRPALGRDLREVLFPPAAEEGTGEDAAAANGGGAVDLRAMLGRGRREEADGGDSEAQRTLDRTRFTQPALFVVEIALARLLEQWGVRPDAMIGYSLGEYVAATLAGVFRLEDALALVAERARLIDELAEGAMLAVALPEDELAPRLGDELSLMAVNAPQQTVVAGPPEAVAALAERLEADGVACRRLPTTHAFHSTMMEPVREALVERLRAMPLAAPRVPYLSNVTGTWITAEEATDPEYWGRHLCEPVRFAEGLAELAAEPGRVLVEVGPAGALASLVHQQPRAAGRPAPVVVSPLRHGFETADDQAYALAAVGKLWLAGVTVSWPGLHGGERRRRVELPAYPFERRRYWIDAVDRRGSAAASDGAYAAPADGVERLYAPTWRRAAPRAPAAAPAGRWLLLAGDGGLGSALAAELAAGGAAVTLVRAGADWAAEEGVYSVDPAQPEHWRRLLDDLGEPPAAVVDLWSLEAGQGALGGPAALAALAAPLADAAAAAGRTLPVAVVVSGAVEVGGEARYDAAGAGRLGAVRPLRRDPRLAARVVDCAPLPAVGEAGGGERLAALARHLAGELAGDGAPPLVALRAGHRWLPGCEALAPFAGATAPAGAPDGPPAVLVTGGLGVLGQGFAAAFAGGGGPARLAVVLPPAFPAPEEWDAWLAADGGAGAVGRRIAALRRVAGAGAEVLPLFADLGDGEAAAAALAEAEARCGPLTAWLHAVEAPEADPGAAELAPGELAAAFDAALAVPRGLGELLAGRPALRRLLVSPAAAGAAPGAAATDAAAAAFDALAAAGRQRGERWLSVAWDGPADAAGPSPEILARLAALDGVSQAVVSARPLGTGWQRLLAGGAERAAGAPAEPPPPAAVGFYPRPELRVEYVAPEGPAQETIAAIWRDLLGVERVGVHDNFLELGGDSLLASRLVTRMREAFGLELPIRLLFEASTVGELALDVEERRRRTEEKEIEALLAEIRHLTDDELESEILKREGVLHERLEE